MRHLKLLRIRTVWMLTAILTLAALQTAAQAPARFIGTITATGNNQLTVKTDAGQSYNVTPAANIDIKRIAPGERDLSKAEAIPFSDLAVGDRALVKLDPSSLSGTLQAVQIIAIKKADVTERQEQEREAWQRHGIGGLVKSVDEASGTITVATGAGQTLKTVTVHTTDKTVMKRYAEGSVRYADAKPAPINAIQPGDQLRARGEKSPDGSELAASEVISGTFRNISGLVSSINTADGTFVVKDLMTKKDVTVKVPRTAQMKQLPEQMAKMLAAAMKGEANGRAPGGARPAGGPPMGNAGEASPSMERMHAQGRSNELQTMLSRAPEITIADLKKGDAVMLVSTQGSNEVTAITLLAGVEPLLQSPAESQNLLSNWSMGTTDTEAASQ
ncbi:MAG: hypothetical protein KGN79_07535 [Acidobacteriota bacterium]|nr:hypothetical protein [Acidobacteriota bacterium]